MVGENSTFREGVENCILNSKLSTDKKRGVRARSIKHQSIPEKGCMYVYVV